MAKSVTQYDLLISCPGDIKDEVDLIQDAVDKFNQLYSDTSGISIRVRHWSKSSYSQSGGKPQAILNQQFVNDCDAAVAIFWTRFGTPTDEYGSGTEEEIELMLQNKKQVFMYFCDKPIAPSLIDDKGRKKVEAFRKSYGSRGLYNQYSTNEEFSQMFFTHLSQHFLTQNRIEAILKETKSDLSLCGIDKDSAPVDHGVIRKFTPNGKRSIDSYRQKIQDLFADINATHLVPAPQYTGMFAELMKPQGTPVSISVDDQKLIRSMADALSHPMSNDFFDLGSLSHEIFLYNPLEGSRPLNGTAEEKHKYNRIIELTKVIENALGWVGFEEAYSPLLCTNLAIKNSGTHFDEDIEVTLFFNMQEFVSHDELPHLEYHTKEYLCKKCGISNLFSIPPSAQIDSYASSCVSPSYSSDIDFPRANYLTPDYDDEFAEDMENVFCYSVFTQGACKVVKLKFDYVKHNTIVAFPTPLFITADVKSVSYKITSKHNPAVKEGILRLQ